jgi:hypothetical protein
MKGQLALLMYRYLTSLSVKMVAHYSSNTCKSASFLRFAQDKFSLPRFPLLVDPYGICLVHQTNENCILRFSPIYGLDISTLCAILETKQRIYLLPTRWLIPSAPPFHHQSL